MHEGLTRPEENLPQYNELRFQLRTNSEHYRGAAPRRTHKGVHPMTPRPEARAGRPGDRAGETGGPGARQDLIIARAGTLIIAVDRGWV
jgi:hypothetical protein